jgi:DMSO/TMAO reductase YedYZ molybdopterin-dependent catalytic subunit
MGGDWVAGMTPGEHRGRLTRRDLLRRSGAIAGGAVLAGAWPPGRRAFAQEPAFPGVAQGMKVISTAPINLETPVRQLRTWITPSEWFFVRLHLPGYAQLSRDNWQLSVDGEVAQPLRLGWGDVRRFSRVALTAWLQCAGNRRGHFEPKAAGGQWDRGAVGNARWVGVRLRDVLLSANPTLKAHHVAFEGSDPNGAAPPYIRSIPMDKALDPYTLLVFEMNGEPLPVLHGFPARAFVPGWVGSASVKWIRALHLTEQEWNGPYMKDLYRMNVVRIDPADKSYTLARDFVPTTVFPVYSFFTAPVAGEAVQAGSVACTGVAYAGETGITKVEVSLDGRPWRLARITTPGSAYAWYQWEFTATLAPGRHELAVRATDWRGRTQPRTALWNPQGYLNNSWDVLTVTAS